MTLQERYVYQVALKTKRGIETAVEFLDKKITQDDLDNLYAGLKEVNSDLGGIIVNYMGSLLGTDEVLMAGITEDEKDV